MEYTWVQLAGDNLGTFIGLLVCSSFLWGRYGALLTTEGHADVDMQRP